MRSNRAMTGASAYASSGSRGMSRQLLAIYDNIGAAAVALALAAGRIGRLKAASGW
jgi:hypothetical protein